MNLNNSIEILKNIGEKRLALFHKLKIFTVFDLLSYYPKSHDDRSEIKKIYELEPEQRNGICITINSSGENIIINGKTMTKFKVQDKTGTLELIWFNMPYLKNNFKRGEEYYFIGKVVEKNKTMRMISPDYEKITDMTGIELSEIDNNSEINCISGGRIVPIYKLTSGITQKMLRTHIFKALEVAKEFIQDNLPIEIIKKYDLYTKKQAIIAVHFPKNDEDFYNARKRLVFEEFFLLHIYYANCRKFVQSKESPFEYLEFPTKPAEDVLGFQLTNAQKNAVLQITKDFSSGIPMNRLVQGDVGSGKTAVALVVSYLIMKNNKQCSLMCPTEVLAVQHYKYFKPLLKQLGFETTLLVGSMKTSDKKNARLDIKNGTTQMVIGTHALIQDKVDFHDLGLVITDEQHRFGVMQRNTLREKGTAPHVLVMTATPIPRTLGMILYGDLDISTINELPPNRQTIKTYAVNSDYRARIFAFIGKEIENGRQAYVICPTIENSKMKDLKSVMSYEEIILKDLPNIRTAVLHGKMSPDEKNEIMGEFSLGNIDVIISTTVIEVGINVPNATIMFIENSERFGLSQLHQLRGRVGRGEHLSYCVLLTDSKSKTAVERAKAMSNTSDGFEISRLDLTLRGHGDFLGTRQHGLPEFKIADIKRDLDILYLAKEAVDGWYKPENLQNSLLVEFFTQDLTDLMTTL